MLTHRIEEDPVIRRLFTVLAAVATVAAVALTTATPALADDFYRWGETSRSFYHYGNPALGSSVPGSGWTTGTTTPTATVYPTAS